MPGKPRHCHRHFEYHNKPLLSVTKEPSINKHHSDTFEEGNNQALLKLGDKNNNSAHVMKVRR